MSTLLDRLLPEALWQRIQPLLPPLPARAPRWGPTPRPGPQLRRRDWLGGPEDRIGVERG